MPKPPANPITCDVWMTVDYGEGPVRVRCTKTGPHDDHVSEVHMEREREVNYRPRNIFDDPEDKDEL